MAEEKSIPNPGESPMFGGARRTTMEVGKAEDM
jgi:hypothetical protein